MRDYLFEPFSRGPLPLAAIVPPGNDPSWTAEILLRTSLHNRALDFLRSTTTKTFLLVISYDEPHGPCLCPIKYSRMYKDYYFSAAKSTSHDDLRKKTEDSSVWPNPIAGRTAAHPQSPVLRRRTLSSTVNWPTSRRPGNRAPGALVLYTSDTAFSGIARLDGQGPRPW